jgi:MFS family permease
MVASSQSQPVGESRGSPWAPFGQPLFRAIWSANVVSSVGGWIHAVAATWLMTSLTASPLLIAMVQSASSLPVVLLALPAGALADIADRRLILLISQAWMMLVAAFLTASPFPVCSLPHFSSLSLLLWPWETL